MEKGLGMRTRAAETHKFEPPSFASSERGVGGWRADQQKSLPEPKNDPVAFKKPTLSVVELR